jgi:hypothetical protein
MIPVMLQITKLVNGAIKTDREKTMSSITVYLKERLDVDPENVDELINDFKLANFKENEFDLTEKKVKRTRDLSGYNVFMREKMQELKKTHPDMESTARFKECSPLWKPLSDDEKAVYNKKAKAIKEEKETNAMKTKDHEDGIAHKITKGIQDDTKTDIKNVDEKPKKTKKKGGKSKI